MHLQVSHFGFFFFVFLVLLKKAFMQSAFLDFLFTAAKKYDSLIYYIYLRLARLFKDLLATFLCAFSVRSSATYG